MRLNRYNYEEFFILYMDNELDAEGRREVEIFVQQNPDLKDELDILIQSKLIPDADITFADKDSLLRFDNSSISLTNYEEWLTSYIDNELTEDERKSVEEFVAANPAIQKELNLLQRAKLEPEEIVFPYKESLYRTTEKARVISIRWVRIAAAAILLFGISTTAIVLLNNNKGQNNNGPTAQKPKEQSRDNGTAIQPANIVPSNELASSPAEKKNDEINETKHSPNALAVKENSIVEKRKEQNEVKDQKPLIAEVKVDEIIRDAQQPVLVPSANGKDNNSGNATTQADKIAITKIDDNSKVGDVTNSPVDAYNKQTGAGIKVEDPEPDPRQFASNDNGNKGLRGFFRKVTRTIEKRTNIKATDDDDRLLIAGLAIKMN